MRPLIFFRQAEDFEESSFYESNAIFESYADAAELIYKQHYRALEEKEELLITTFNRQRYAIEDKIDEIQRERKRLIWQ